MDKIGLIYPVMYLYRHYVEITIKDAVALAESFTWVGTARPKRLGHSLLDLWRELLANVKMLQGDEPACELDTLHGGLVGKLHAIDPFGDSFRYPLNTSGKAQFQMNLEIDLLEMRERSPDFTTLSLNWIMIFENSLTLMTRMLRTERISIDTLEQYDPTM